VCLVQVRGPKTSPYVDYIMHVRTAFTVRGVARRFSAFHVRPARARAPVHRRPGGSRGEPRRRSSLLLPLPMPLLYTPLVDNS